MARSLHEHLVSGDGMARLAAHAQRLQQLQLRFQSALPEALRPYARVANFRLGKLFIHTVNGAVAAKIRQLGPRIASKLCNEVAQVTEIEVRVQAWSRPPTAPLRKRPTLPGENQKQGLTSLKNALPDDSPLKGALTRLLRTLKE